MKNSLRQILISMTNNRGDSESLISRCILEMIDINQKPTLEEVSKRAFISKSAIVKFCQKLGFDGFTTFIAVFLEQDKYYYKSNNFKSNPPSNILKEFKDKNNENFQFIDKQLEQVEWFANNIRKYKNVYIYSSSEDYLEAQIIYDQLSIFKDINLKFSINRAKWNYTNSFDKETLVIFLVSGIESNLMINIYKIAQSNAAKVFIICTYNQSFNFSEVENKIIVKTENLFPWYQVKNILFTYTINLLIYFLNHKYEDYYKQVYNPKFKY